MMEREFEQADTASSGRRLKSNSHLSTASGPDKLPLCKEEAGLDPCAGQNSQDEWVAASQLMYSEVPAKYRAVRLPYKNSSSLAAVFVLPDECYASVAEAAWDTTAQMVMRASAWAPLRQRLILRLPRFKVQANMSLKEVRVQWGEGQLTATLSSHHSVLIC
jgi:hypothetical protein